MGTSSAALFKNGDLIAAIEEERLTRKKNDNSFPHLSIDEVLDIAGISLKDVSVVAVYWKPWKILTRAKGTLKKIFLSSDSRKSILKRAKELFTSSSKNNDGSWLDLFFIKNILLKKDSQFIGKVKYFDHHLTHQKYGEAIKNWKNFISLSFDGGGESDSTVLTVVNNGRKEVLLKHKWPNSLGHFYSTFTGFLGFKMLEGEYKMMGLAPYGKPKFKRKILSKILILKNNGEYRLNTKICDYHSALKGHFNEEFFRLFGEKRSEDQTPSQDHIDIACSVQEAFEDCLKHILKPALKKYPNIKKLVISGGCALNVTANGKLISSNFVDEVIIPPAPHDAGCSIGAGLLSIKNNINLESVRNPYLGRNFSDKAIFEELSRHCKNQLNKLEENQLIDLTVEYLIDGKLIGWFQGGAEFGPRALGARSFLADPRNDKIRDDINRKIKKRELFRPFAPSVLEEESENIFELNQNSPYMNIIAKVKSLDIPAVTHIDRTARVHTVSKQSHERYHKLIKKFGDRTGIPVLLNTSFNVQEPIVYSPRDAVNTFIKSEVDILVIGDYLLTRYDLLLN